MTPESKEQLRKEFANIAPPKDVTGKYRPLHEELDWRYRDAIFDFMVSKLEEKDSAIHASERSGETGK